MVNKINKEGISNIGASDISELFFQLMEVKKQKEMLEKLSELIEEIIKDKGYSIKKTDRKITIIFVGANKLLCADGKIRKERPKIRKSIEKLMKNKKLDICEAVKYIEENKNDFSVGYLTQVRKMEYESLTKKEMAIDIAKYNENIEIA